MGQADLISIPRKRTLCREVYLNLKEGHTYNNLYIQHAL